MDIYSVVVSAFARRQQNTKCVRACAASSTIRKGDLKANLGILIKSTGTIPFKVSDAQAIIKCSRRRIVKRTLRLSAK